jgi:mRNA interferase MazF
MIQLTPQQLEAVTAGGDAPLTLIDPQTQTAYVLVRKEAYDELTAGSQAEVERLAAAIDWTSAREAMRPPQEWFEGDEPKPFWALAGGSMPPRLTTGRIVWADIADPNGHRKLRPAVIVTPTNQLALSRPIDVVAVTSRLKDPLPDDHVLLPWHAQGHPRTGLNRRCAAVCTWLAQVSEGDIQDMAGMVPAPAMKAILTKIAGALPPSALEPPSDP